MKVSALLGLILLTNLLHGAEPTRYRPAYYREGEVCFDSPIALDGAHLAKKYFELFPLTNPDRGRLAEASEDRASARFTFTAPLDRRLRNLSYWVIHEAGIERLWLKRLEGTVIYDSPEEANPTARVEVAVCGVGRVPVKDAGFVVLAEPPISPRWAISGVAVGPTNAARIDTRQVTIPQSRSGMSAVKAAFTFVDPAGGRRYLLVRRVPDTYCKYACCESSYDLFAVGADLLPVASNDYDCDL